MKDEMKIGDKEVKVSVSCAKCGEPVKQNESHNCQEKENKNENTTEA
jgi:hypothetical protein